MKINVANLKKDIGATRSFHFIISADSLDFDDQPQWLTGQLIVDGKVMNNGQNLSVSGLVRGRGTFSCSRCLEPFSLPLTIPFSEEFKEDAGAQADEDIDVTFFQGDEIDLTETVRESIVLAEPLKPVCAEDCRGLCPHCGINLNKESCDCEQTAIDPRLEKLRALLNK